MSSENVLRFTVNGREAEAPAESTVYDVVESMGYDTARIAVEIDGCVCPRCELPTRRVMGGERMEVVSFVGGG